MNICSILFLKIKCLWPKCLPFAPTTNGSFVLWETVPALAHNSQHNTPQYLSRPFISAELCPYLNLGNIYGFVKQAYREVRGSQCSLLRSLGECRCRASGGHHAAAHAGKCVQLRACKSYVRTHTAHACSMGHQSDAILVIVYGSTLQCYS